jgi:sigma-B regulation protein RsbU (phosphoserine phosphatase)
VGVIALATGATATILTLRARDSLQLQSQTYQASDQNLSTLLTSFVDAETGERGFLITSETRYLQPYYYGTHRAPVLLRLLSERLHRYQGLLKEIHTISQRYDSWQTTVAIPAINDASEGDSVQAVAAERSGYAKLEFDRLRASVDRLSQTLHIDYTSSSKVTNGDLGTVLLFLPIEVALLIGLLISVWLLMVHHITRPLQRLASQARAIGDGNVTATIVVEGPKEIEELSADVEAMRRRLRSDFDELRQLRNALRRHSPVTMMVRSELESTTEPSRISIAGEISPAEGVLAGDWYDVWEDRDRISLVVMDVSGHGSEAGMIALRLKHLIDPPMQMGLEPGEAVGWLRDFIGPLGDSSATGIIATIDLSEGLCSFANAGHPSGFIISSGVIRTLERTGPLLSDLGGEWQTERTPIGPGDLLVLVTDGLLEARLHTGEQYGMDRLVQVVETIPLESEPASVVEQILSSVHTICATPLSDDATVVALRVAAPD